MITRLLKRLSSNNSTALEVYDRSENIYTISGVRREIVIPDMGIVDDELLLEFDIAIFEGSFKLTPVLGYSKPLFKLMIGQNTGFNLLWFTKATAQIIENSKTIPNAKNIAKELKRYDLITKVSSLSDIYHGGDLVGICVVEKLTR